MKRINSLLTISVCLACVKAFAVETASDDESKKELSIKDEVMVDMAKSLLSQLESDLKMIEIKQLPADDVMATIVEYAFGIGHPISLPHYTVSEQIDQTGLTALSKIVEQMKTLLNMKHVVENEQTYKLLTVNLRSVLYGLLHQLQTIACKYYLCVYGTCTLKGYEEINRNGQAAAAEGMWKMWDSWIHQSDLFYGVANPENGKGLPALSLDLGKQFLADAVQSGSLSKELPPIGKDIFARYIFTSLELNYMTYVVDNFVGSDSTKVQALINDLLYCECYDGFFGQSCTECK